MLPEQRLFRRADNPSMIGLILKVAGYTYGPLLELFAFGTLTRRMVKGVWVPYVALLAPLVCFGLDVYQKVLLGSYEIGLELLIINGLLTFVGLWSISSPGAAAATSFRTAARLP